MQTAFPAEFMARSLSSRIRLAAIVLLVVASGCDRRSAQQGGIPPPSGEVVPCFPEWGEVAFVVNGVPVPAATVDRFAAFYKSMGVQPEDKAKAKAIDEAILFTAAVYADYRDQGKLEAWSKRVRDAERRLKAGESFAEVAKTCSDCSTKTVGGDLGEPFTRGKNVAPLTEAAFRMEPDELGPPIVTVFGAHLLKVTGKIHGSSPERDQRTGAHVLIAFDPTAVTDVTGYWDRVQKLKKEARVESVKDPYKKLIPTANRR